MTLSVYLPTEIIELIFIHLSFRDNLEMAQANRQLRWIASHHWSRLPLYISGNHIVSSNHNKNFTQTKSKPILITRQNLIKMAIPLSQVTVVDASQRRDACPIALAIIAPFLAQLSSINLSGNDAITDQTLFSIASACPRLQNLELEHCIRLGPLSMDHIAQLPYLETLNICSTQLATCNTIHQLVTACRNTLKSLNLSKSYSLGHRDWNWILEKIGSECTQLETLNLSSNHALTDEALNDWKVALEKRRGINRMELDVRDCEQLSLRSLELLQKSLGLALQQNARLLDYSSEGIRDYIQMLMGI